MEVDWATGSISTDWKRGSGWTRDGWCFSGESGTSRTNSGDVHSRPIRTMVRSHRKGPKCRENTGWQSHGKAPGMATLGPTAGTTGERAVGRMVTPYPHPRRSLYIQDVRAPGLQAHFLTCSRGQNGSKKNGPGRTRPGIESTMAVCVRPGCCPTSRAVFHIRSSECMKHMCGHSNPAVCLPGYSTDASDGEGRRCAWIR